MANVIQIKRGSGAPTSAQLASYELGYATTDNILYINKAGTIIPLATNLKNFNLRGSDLILGTSSSSSNDSSDIQWQYGNGQEKARIWTSDDYTAKTALYFREYKSDGTQLYNGYLVLGDGTGASGTWGISISGNATTVTYPQGFSSRSTNATWGNQTGTTVTDWDEADGGSIDFRKNNPSSGKISIKVDGRFYFNEGNTPAGGLASVNGYWGMTDPDGTDSVWLRTTSKGLLPYQSGGVASGHQSLGTSTWYFSTAYVSNIHGGSAEFTNGSVEVTAGNISAGTNGNTDAERRVYVQSGAGQMYLYSQASTSGSRGIWIPAHGSGSAKSVFSVDTNNNVTFNGTLSGNASSATSAKYLSTIASIGSSSTSHATALKNQFDSNKANITRNVLINFYDSSGGNGSIDMGYFLSGYDTGPYGGFFVAHYNSAYYVGISGGTYTQFNLLTSTTAYRVVYSSSQPSASTGVIWLKPI